MGPNFLRNSVRSEWGHGEVPDQILSLDIKIKQCFGYEDVLGPLSSVTYRYSFGAPFWCSISSLKREGRGQTICFSDWYPGTIFWPSTATFKKLIPMKSNSPSFCVWFLLGLCLEKLPISSSTSNLHVDREQDVITCYEKAGDIALLYLQEIERVSEDHVFLPLENVLKFHIRS